MNKAKTFGVNISFEQVISNKQFCKANNAHDALRMVNEIFKEITNNQNRVSDEGCLLDIYKNFCLRTNDDIIYELKNKHNLRVGLYIYDRNSCLAKTLDDGGLIVNVPVNSNLVYFEKDLSDLCNITFNSVIKSEKVSTAIYSCFNTYIVYDKQNNCISFGLKYSDSTMGDLIKLYNHDPEFFCGYSDLTKDIMNSAYNNCIIENNSSQDTDKDIEILKYLNTENIDENSRSNGIEVNTSFEQGNKDVENNFVNYNIDIKNGGMGIINNEKVVEEKVVEITEEIKDVENKIIEESKNIVISEESIIESVCIQNQVEVITEKQDKKIIEEKEESVIENEITNIKEEDAYSCNKVTMNEEVDDVENNNEDEEINEEIYTQNKEYKNPFDDGDGLIDEEDAINNEILNNNEIQIVENKEDEKTEAVEKDVIQETHKEVIQEEINKEEINKQNTIGNKEIEKLMDSHFKENQKIIDSNEKDKSIYSDVENTKKRKSESKKKNNKKKKVRICDYVVEKISAIKQNNASKLISRMYDDSMEFDLNELKKKKRMCYFDNKETLCNACIIISQGERKKTYYISDKYIDIMKSMIEISSKKDNILQKKERVIIDGVIESIKV